MLGRSIQKDGTLLCIMDGHSCVVSPSHKYYSKLYAAFKDNNDADFSKWYSADVSFDDYTKQVTDGVKESGDLLSVKDGKVYYKGNLFVNSISEAIERIFNAGLDVQPLVNFCKRLVKNPSYNSVQQLFKFLDIHKLVITEDGCFLAYKTLKSDYTDKHTGKVDNRPGAMIPRFERNEVEDNPNVHCGKGYHCGAIGYSGPGGSFNSATDKVVIVKVAPEDVISVPNDHSCQKLRCCWYEIVSDYQGDLVNPIYSGKVNDDYSEDYEYDEDNEEDYSWDIEDFADIGYGDILVFNYAGEARCGVVENVDDDNLMVQMIMCDNDKSANQYRNFNFTKMADIKYYSDEGDLPIQL